MRLDKFLKKARIIKRRTVATSLAKEGKILVNGRVVKPAYEVKNNDIIEIFGLRRYLKLKVENFEKLEYSILEDLKKEAQNL